jgi:hypothetical protein
MDPFDDDHYPVNAPGWAAIDHVLSRLYPGQVPHQFASKTAYDLDSTSPLPAISVCEGRGPDHWHYVTYGLTELFEKTSSRVDVSGFGFELTLRLPRRPDDDRPPVWALRLLQGLGGFVLAGHGPLDTGHVVDLGGPLDADDSGLTGVVLVPDPQLGKVDGPHGSILFLAVFGLAPDEVEAMQAWDLRRKVGLVAEVEPLAITDPTRPPLREDRRAAPIFRRYATGILV